MGFNITNYLQELAEGEGSPLDNALNNPSYGVPQCILELGQKALSLLPYDVLTGLRIGALQGKINATNDINSVLDSIRESTGISNLIDENGRLKFLSEWSSDGMDLSKSLGSILGYIDGITSYGQNMYRSGQQLYEEFNKIKDCIKSLEGNYKANYTGIADRTEVVTPDGQTIEERFESALADAGELSYLRGAQNFIAQADEFVENIDNELRRRLADPSTEPQFDGNVDVNNIFPSFTNNVVTEPEIPKEIFRLSYGPPKAKSGQFILSVDGIYYDSQSEGLPPIFTEIKRRKDEILLKDVWQFQHDPNVGGRGIGISNKEVKTFVNNALDINKINDSPFFAPYYDQDNFLEQLTAHKNKRIYDLSAQITDLENSGDPSEADIFNLRQSLMSEVAHYQEKINKRKKQIELAVTFGSTKYKPGKVPLNDFSYLENKNILFDIQKQKKITVTYDDVDGIILPVQATYVSPPKDNIIQNLDHLVLSLVGEANIIESASAYSGIDATRLHTTTQIVSDGLVAVYNFLETHIEQFSSTQYLLDNCITNNNLLNAKIIASSISSLYPLGLGVAYLNGLVSLSSTGGILGYNNSVVLKENKQLNDLLYSRSGAAFDFWIHVPDLIPSSTGATQQYKIILANENFGLQQNVNPQTNINNIKNDSGFSNVKGFLMGFTRDRRISQGLTAESTDNLNYASATCFFLAPTQSLDSSSIGFINKSESLKEEDCFSLTESFCLRIPLNQTNDSGYGFSSVSSAFQHVAITFDPNQDLVDVYLNGTLMATSSMSQVFPIIKGNMPRLPTFTKANSFSYSYVSLPNGPDEVIGVQPVKYTPWVLGGGFTDGYPNGNFLGTSYGGMKSGLGGYLGSFKFYNKTLNSSQVLNNYEAQKAFFKNIDLD